MRKNKKNKKNKNIEIIYSLKLLYIHYHINLLIVIMWLASQSKFHVSFMLIEIKFIYHRSCDLVRINGKEIFKELKKRRSNCLEIIGYH